MSKNSDVLFSTLPRMNIHRSIFDMPQDIKTSFDVGQLIPFFVMEVLPSDTIKLRTNKVVRVQTFHFPVFENMYLDTAYFFVPNRLVWSHWKEFMGENTNSAYLPDVEYTVPKIICGDAGEDTADPNSRIQTGDVLDYMGLPVQNVTGGSGKTNKITPISLPYRAYQLIWNEFYRDQNLQAPVNINTGDSNTLWTNVSSTDKKPLPVNKYHDIFTSALKAPAKVAGGSIFAPIQARSSKNTVIAAGNVNSTVSDYALHGEWFNNGSLGKANFYATNATAGDAVKVVTPNNNPSNPGFHPDNLVSLNTDYDYHLSIPDLRLAFQMQKFLERDAASGTRYQEMIMSHFKTVAQDSRMQRPEYLGGNRIPLNISQVINQAQTASDALGDVGGMSVTTDSNYDVEFSSFEHGFIIGVCCARYDHSYPEGFEPWWFRDSKYKYYWPEFAHLTDQPVYVWALNANGIPTQGDNYNINSVFGYVERYAEYKFRQNKVTGELRPGISNSLASWHFADYYGSSLPRLSGDWLKEDKTNVDRTLTVTSAAANQIFGDFYVECRATRPMPVHSMPGFADHF